MNWTGVSASPGGTETFRTCVVVSWPLWLNVSISISTGRAVAGSVWSNTATGGGGVAGRHVGTRGNYNQLIISDGLYVTCHLNPATKQPENPVLPPGEPHPWDRLCVCWPGAELCRPCDQKFRCWYSGMDVVQSPDWKSLLVVVAILNAISLATLAEELGVLPLCDVLVVTVPGTSETFGMVGKAELGRMKKTALVIHVARGGIVDETARAGSLGSGELAGAVLDCFTKEPLPREHSHFGAPNLILTPHMSGGREDFRTTIAKLLAEHLRRFREGRPVLNRVDGCLEY